MLGTVEDPYAPECFLNCNDSIFNAAYLPRLQLAKNAHFNVLLGFNEGLGSTKTERRFTLPADGYEAQKMLNAAASMGIQYVVGDFNITGIEAYSHGTAPQSPSTPSHADFYATYPSFGYNVWDEPVKNVPNSPDGWTSYLNQRFPDKHTYVKMYSAGVWTTTYRDRDSLLAAFEAYVDAIARDPVAVNRPSILSFDYFPFYADTTDTAHFQQGVPTTLDSVGTFYFYNLATVRAKANGTPFWTEVLSTPHWHRVTRTQFRDDSVSSVGHPIWPIGNAFAAPTAEQLRFMTMCPIAYGAKGLAYFTYDSPPSWWDNPDASRWYFGDAIIAADHVTPIQPKYDNISNINNYIEKVLGPVVMRSMNLGAWHKSTAPTGEVMGPDMLIGATTPVVADADLSTLVGVFRDTTACNTFYVLVVNKSLTPVTETVALRGNLDTKVFTAPSMVGYSGDMDYTAVATTYAASDDRTRLTLTLQGGEGRLLKVLGVSSPYGSDPQVEWSPRTSAMHPSPRWGASMIYDPTQGRVILFGGRSAQSDGTGIMNYNDTWQYTPGTGLWSQLSVADSIPPAASLDGHQAIYDPGRAGVAPRMLVMNGASVWALTLTGSPTWSRLTTTSQTGSFPAARDNFVAIYDPTGDQLVICGGRNDASTWKLNLSTLQWAPLANMPGSATHRMAGVYDPVHKRLLVFGGVSYFTPPSCAIQVAQASQQVLALSLQGTPAWTSLPNGPWLNKSASMGASWDSKRSRVVLYGGVFPQDLCGLGVPCDQTEFHAEGPSGGLWCSDASVTSWSVIAARVNSCLPPPAARGRHAITYLPGQHDQFLVFGGGSFTQICATPSYTFLGDTWALDADVISPATSPVTPTIYCTEIDIAWTAPGDDGRTGDAAWFELRRRTTPITDANFTSCTLVRQGASELGGQPQAVELMLGVNSTKYYYGLRVRDESFNWSLVTTTGLIGTPPSGGGCSGGGAQSKPDPEAAVRIPTEPGLSIAPNPVRGLSTLRYALPKKFDGRDFDVSVFDLSGRRLRTLAHGPTTPGFYEVSWNPADGHGGVVRSGVYFVRLSVASEGILSRRMLVIR